MKPNWPVKKFGEIILLIALVVVLLVPFAYIYFYNPTREFWDNAIGNLLATVLALVAGIPVALWIDRFIKRREEKEKYSLERKREKELLELVKEELDFSSARLNDRSKDKGSLPIQPLKTDLWEAASSSGAIHLIENPKLLNRIASAYYVLKTVKRIEEECHKALRGATVTFSDGTTATQRLLTDARGFDNLLSESIEEALKLIDHRIKEL